MDFLDAVLYMHGSSIPPSPPPHLILERPGGDKLMPSLSLQVTFAIEKWDFCLNLAEINCAEMEW